MPGAGVTVGATSEKPTTIGVPFKADAGMVPDTVSGAVNVVGITWTQVAPFQYSMTLAGVKLGFVMVTTALTPGPKGPLLEVTEMS